MDPSMAGAGIGGGIGILQTLADMSKRDTEQKRREAELLMSPWTKMSFDQMTKPRDVNTFKNIASGTEAGASQGQAIQQQQAWDQLAKQLIAQNAPQVSSSSAMPAGAQQLPATAGYPTY